MSVKRVLQELVLIAPKKVAAEAKVALEERGIPVRLGRGGHPTVRVPAVQAAEARKIVEPFSTCREHLEGYTLVVTGPEQFAAEAGARLTKSGLRFERMDVSKGRVTIRVPILQNGLGIDEVYPLEAPLISASDAAYWRCPQCRYNFSGAVDRCPSCRAFVGDAHAL